MSLPILICTLLAAVLIWRLVCIFRARPMGMIVSWPVVVDLLATALSALSAGASIHYLLYYDPVLTNWILLPAAVSVIALTIAFIAASERRRRGGEVYSHA